MNNLLCENVNNEKLDFSYIKGNKFLSDPTKVKSMAIRNAQGSSFLEGIVLPEHFFLTSYESLGNNIN